MLVVVALAKDGISANPSAAAVKKTAINEPPANFVPHADDKLLRNGLSAFGSGDRKKALALLLPLAARGDERAQRVVGIIILVGSPGTQQNSAAAFKWMKRAAEQGSPEAQAGLIGLYELGEGVKKDKVEALKWVIPAKEKLPAVERLARKLTQSLTPNQRADAGIRAMEWRREMRSGDDKASIRARKRLYQAVAALRKKEYGSAIPHLTAAADAGNTWAQNTLAQTLLRGRGVPSDPKAAAALYRRASGKNSFNDPGVRMAQGNLAALYWTGRGVKLDKSTAIELYEKSARNGFRPAQLTLANIFLRGDGIKTDAAASGKWLMIAAANRAPNAVKTLPKYLARYSQKTVDDARRQVMVLFPKLSIPEYKSTFAGNNPKLKIVSEKGLPRTPVASSAGFTAEFERIYNAPMSENAKLIPYLRNRIERLSPPLIFELARRTFETDKEEAVTLFWLARLRAMYDARRCTDKTAAQGVFQWNNVVTELLAYVRANPSVSNAGKNAALGRESGLSEELSPAWICFHGIFAMRAATAGKDFANWHKPKSEWPQLRQMERAALRRSIKK